MDVRSPARRCQRIFGATIACQRWVGDLLKRQISPHSAAKRADEQWHKTVKNIVGPAGSTGQSQIAPIAATALP
jgi:hypothetical protein